MPLNSPSPATSHQPSPPAHYAQPRQRGIPGPLTQIEQEELFIEIIKKYPSVWDHQCSGYKIKQTKTNAWNEICRLCPYTHPHTFPYTPKSAKSTLKRIRDTYTKCHAKNQKKTKKSGAAASTLYKCRHYDLLGFLSDTASSQPADDNLHPLNKPADDNLHPLNKPAPPTTLAPNSPTRFGNMTLPSSSLQHQQPPAPASQHQQGYACDERTKEKGQALKRKRQNEGLGDKMMADLATSEDRYLASVAAMRSSQPVQEQEDGIASFCKSMAADLRTMSVRGQRLAKLKLQNTLTECLIDDDAKENANNTNKN
jgi:hypothetical protein